MKYKMKDLFLAEIRYFEVGKGVEISGITPHTIIRKKEDGSYENVFNIMEKLPVCKKSSYAEYDKNDNVIGTKILPISEIKESGFIYVIDNKKQIFDNYEQEEIDKETLENIVLKSKMYFKDRKMIVREKFSTKKSIKNLSLLTSIYYTDNEIEKRLDKSDSSVKTYVANKTYIKK